MEYMKYCAHLLSVVMSSSFIIRVRYYDKEGGETKNGYSVTYREWLCTVLVSTYIVALLNDDVLKLNDVRVKILFESSICVDLKHPVQYITSNDDSRVR